MWDNYSIKVMRSEMKEEIKVFKSEEEVLYGLSLYWLIVYGLIMVQGARIAFAKQRLCVSVLFLAKTC